MAPRRWSSTAEEVATLVGEAEAAKGEAEAAKVSWKAAQTREFTERAKAEAAYYRAVLAHERAEAKLSVSDAIAEEVSTAVLGAEVKAAALPHDDPESAASK